MAGGYDSGSSGNGAYSPVATTELYVPATNSWRKSTSLGAGRAGAVMAGLPDGDVLAAGGVTNGYPDIKLLATSEIYSPSTDTWRSAARLPTATANAMSVKLSNGEVFVAGGYGSIKPSNGNATAPPLASTEIYDPKTNAWIAAPDMPFGLVDAQLVSLPNGRVLAIGGLTGNPQRPVVLARAEIYRP